MRAVVAAVGRELLIGRTRDANAWWLCGRLAALGSPAGRVALLDDDPQQIALETRRIVQDGFELALFCGGLGPTFDDLTLAGVAAGLGLELAERPETVSFVARRYQELHDQGLVASAELTEERRKMAALPAGARLLDNRVGTAPGALLERPLLLACLPGVPAEMQPMFDEQVAALIAGREPGAAYREAALLTDCNDESLLGRATLAVQARRPGLYVKSHAARFGRAERLRITVAAWGSSDQARREVEAGLAELIRELARLGVSTQGET